jgi:hypothetical protein
MKFEEKFKEGDVICSDNFYNGKLMVVKYFTYRDFIGRIGYTCEDLFLKNQNWSAHEYGCYFDKPYNWRLATDEDYIRELNKRIEVSEDMGRYGKIVVNEGIDIYINNYSDSITLTPEEALQLRDVINKYVGGNYEKK